MQARFYYGEHVRGNDGFVIDVCREVSSVYFESCQLQIPHDHLENTKLSLAAKSRRDPIARVGPRRTRELSLNGPLNGLAHFKTGGFRYSKNFIRPNATTNHLLNLFIAASGGRGMPPFRFRAVPKISRYS
ncbi:hypothetical protein EVAR_61795_1 [Eumeta japonica]|uniref:Uncharacterized protein n=1 Tax=Eumeta variegata TaxID=151549 RepID=A0A4C1Z2P8_EUMVA|nr:hypothetical protein EVAR_61795_1 [Eumeta japonica]